MHSIPNSLSWSSALSASASAADALILIAAIVAGISALHTVCLDYLIPSVGRMLGYLPESPLSSPKAGSPEAILHAPPPPPSPHLHETDRVDEKMGTRQRATAPARHSHDGHNPRVESKAHHVTTIRQGSRPLLVQSLPNSFLSNAARQCLKRIMNSTANPGSRSSASAAKLVRWMREHPPFGPDFTPDAVNATWNCPAHSMHVDPLSIKIQAHIAMARQSNARCCGILQDAFHQLTIGSARLTEYIDIAVQAMCVEEAWDLLGHFQYISMEPAQLHWIQKCVEDWRRSDQGLLCSSAVPLFGNPEALLYLLAAPGQSIKCRVMALHELAAMDHGTWTRCADQLGALELLEILADLPGAQDFSKMIVRLLIHISNTVFE